MPLGNLGHMGKRELRHAAALAPPP